MASTVLLAPTDSTAPLPPARPPAGQARVRFRMARVIVALMLREIATRYGRSPGGYLWQVAEPIGGIVMLSVVFSLTFNTPPIGTNFPLFYASGFLPFSLYQDIQATVSRSIPYSRPLLQYPCVTYMDAMIARLLLNFVTQLVVILMILGGIDFIYGLDLHWNLPRLLGGIMMATTFGAAVGVVNGYLFMEFPVWERAWSILTRPLFLVSGVFFLFSQLPHQAKEMMWYNPLVHVIGMTRGGIYGTYNVDYVSPMYVYAVSIVMIFFGLLLMNRHHSRLLES